MNTRIQAVVIEAFLSLSLHGSEPQFLHDADTSFLSFAVAPKPRAPKALRVDNVIEDADYVTIQIFNVEKKEFGKTKIIVRDRVWIKQMATAIGSVFYGKSSHMIAISPAITFYDKAGVKLLDLQIFHKVIRIDGMDYEVGAKTTATLAELIGRETKG